MMQQMKPARSSRSDFCCYLWVLGTALPAACLALVMLVISTPVCGGELRTYNPPIQQTLPSQPVPMLQQRPVGSDFYTRFSTQVQGLTPEQKSQLFATFAARRNQARQEGNWSEAQHYSRLLSILSQ